MGWKQCPRLPYGSRVVEWDASGAPAVEEIEIPESEKQAYLDEHFPFVPTPRLDEQRFDVRARKVFRVGDFRVIRKDNLNLMCSPYYWDSGGTILDWRVPMWLYEI